MNKHSATPVKISDSVAPLLAEEVTDTRVFWETSLGGIRLTGATQRRFGGT
jgi:hypothetical protein